MSCHCYLQWGRSIGSHKLQTGQLNLSGLSAKGTRHSGISKTSLEYELCEGKHGYRPGYSCESQIVTVCKDTADSPGWGSQDRRDNWFFKGFRFSSVRSAAYENWGLRSGCEGSRMGEGIPFWSFAESHSWRTLIWGSHSNWAHCCSSRR